MTVPGGCRSQGCHGYPSRSARSGSWPHLPVFRHHSPSLSIVMSLRSVMDVTPDNKRSGTKPKPNFKSSDPSFTHITMLNTQGIVSGKQGNQSRYGSGSIHLNLKILACPACNENHVLIKCQNFKRKTFLEHVQIMRKVQLCHSCFQYGHIALGCLTKGACQVYGCKQRHHTLLHPYQQGSNINQASEESVTRTTQIPQT